MKHEEQTEAIKAAAGKFPATFGLQAFPGDTFRVSERSSYFSGDTLTLYTERLCDGVWKSFAKGTPKELAGQVVPITTETESAEGTTEDETTLPPDPDEQNDDRAEWAAAAITAFTELTGTDEEDALAELLCDLAHWADRNGYSFTDELERAMGHYKAETTADGEPDKQE